MSKEILLVVQAISNEKGVERQIVFEAIEAALTVVTCKNIGCDADIRVVIDHDTGYFKTYRRWLIIDDVDEDLADDADEDLEYDAERHLLQSQAAEKCPQLEIGSYYEELIDNVQFGRIVAQQARQVILQKLREAERKKIVEHYLGSIGTLINGQVKKVLNDSLIVEFDNGVEGFLPRDRLVGRESYRLNDQIRAVIHDVKLEGRGPQIVLCRTSTEMIKRMFELEIPEVAENIIEIKAVVREAGVRSKVVVSTNKPRMDAVGACVGMRGCRVQAITGALNNESIDIIPWSDDIGQLAINMLAPARIETIDIDEDNKSMDVVVAEEGDTSMAMAIGRQGINVRLAMQATGWHINIMNKETRNAKRNKTHDEWLESLTSNLDVDESIASALIENGFTSIESIAHADIAEIVAIEGFEEDDIADEIYTRAKNGLLMQALSKDIKVADETLLAMDGMTDALASKLAHADICSMEELAELSVDELMEIEDGMDEEYAVNLILQAREPWFATSEN